MDTAGAEYLITAPKREQQALRVSGGMIALNGGGGEIFRNFFYLRDYLLYPARITLVVL